MPTNTNAYNSRITDEALEKRFRDTFRSQGGAELVDDLYAQGVIVPVVDFTAAATGSQLPENLQTAWDFATGHTTTANTTDTLISTAGFWKVNVNLTMTVAAASSSVAAISITDGLTSKPIWEVNAATSSITDREVFSSGNLVVFLKAGESLTATSNATYILIDTHYRQIATVSGDLVSPSGFTSS